MFTTRRKPMEHSEYGRYTREALQRLARLEGAEVRGPVFMTHQPELPGVIPGAGERSRELYEQVGTLYRSVERDQEGHGDIGYVDEMADFLATVARALAAPSGATAHALATALRRFEADRTGTRG
jgi:hypothetical protein